MQLGSKIGGSAFKSLLVTVKQSVSKTPGESKPSDLMSNLTALDEVGSSRCLPGRSLVQRRHIQLGDRTLKGLLLYSDAV